MEKKLRARGVDIKDNSLVTQRIKDEAIKAKEELSQSPLYDFANLTHLVHDGKD